MFKLILNVVTPEIEAILASQEIRSWRPVSNTSATWELNNVSTPSINF
jgi:hypothetical protein